MPDSMLQFQHDDGKPTFEDVYERFGLTAVDVDQDYGVVRIDPRAGLYVVLIKPDVTEKVRARLAQHTEHPAEGIFGSPRVEATGPPEME